MTESLLSDTEISADRTHPVVGLHSGPGAGEWFAAQSDLGVLPWEPPAGATLEDGLDPWVEAAAEHLATFERRVHLLATGETVYATIAFAARHPELAMSLLLGDPEVDPSAEGYAATLKAVVAPTLVIASDPEAESDAPRFGEDVRPPIARAQSIAGGIDNGVFVVIDGSPVPAHRERPVSFNEWVTSFTVIAEGLVALTQQRQEARAQEELHD